MTGDERRIAVVTAGLGDPSSSTRLAERLDAAVTAALAARGIAARVTTIEVRELVHDIATATLSPARPSTSASRPRSLGRAGAQRFAPPELDRALTAVGTADGVIAISPIFNASFSGLFKSFVDLLEPASLAGRPVLLGATGGSERHSLALDHALRPLFSYLHALVLPTGVFAVSGELGATPADDDVLLASRIARAAEELADAVARRPAARAAVGADLDLEDLLVAID